jgi:hypothetical protein
MSAAVGPPGRPRAREEAAVTGRVIAWGLVVAAAAAIGVHFGSGGISIAEVWARIDANSLVGLQGLVEQRLDPDPEDPTLYFDYVLPALNASFWLTAAVLSLAVSGTILAARTFRRHRTRRRFH